MLINIDGDVVVYEAGHSAQSRRYDVLLNGKVVFSDPYKKAVNAWLISNVKPEQNYEVVKVVDPGPLSHSLHNVDNLLSSIINAVPKVTEYQIYLSGSDNFRLELYPNYKIHRSDDSRPHWFSEIRKHMITRWDAVVVNGMEADDALGLSQQTNSVLASIDKDLDVVPGTHYDWQKDLMYDVSEEDANFCFWFQMLVGDASDNIVGIPGIGKKTARSMLNSIGPEAWKDHVQSVYRLNGMYEDWYDLNCKLIWIKQQRPEIF